MDLLAGYLMDALRWLVIVILAFVYPSSFSAWDGRVIEIVRADEFKVIPLGNMFGGPVNVRLYGVDCPLIVRHQPFGKEAKAYAVRRLLGRVVRVQPLPGLVKGSWYKPKKFVPKDELWWEGNIDTKYDRVIALVHMSGINMTEEYLSNGIGWWYKPFVPFELGYKYLQDQAQKARKGLWALPNPVPPWKWQKTPLVKVNPWQQKKWVVVGFAAIGILIIILVGMLAAVLARRLRRRRLTTYSLNESDLRDLPGP